MTRRRRFRADIPEHSGPSPSDFHEEAVVARNAPFTVGVSDSELRRAFADVGVTDWEIRIEVPPLDLNPDLNGLLTREELITPPRVCGHIHGATFDLSAEDVAGRDIPNLVRYLVQVTGRRRHLVLPSPQTVRLDLEEYIRNSEVSTEERSTEEVDKMSMNVIRLETGKLSQGTNLTARMWATFVTRTGNEVGITKVPEFLRKVYRNQRGGFEGSTMRVVEEWEVLKPCRIKINNNVSAFGKMRRFAGIFIDLHPDDATIELNGMEEFGVFQGRGSINFDESYYQEGRSENMKHLTEDDLKQYFGLRMLQPPRRAVRTQKVRSIIY